MTATHPDFPVTEGAGMDGNAFQKQAMPSIDFFNWTLPKPFGTVELVIAAL
jgi:hypothetical protein